MGDHEEPGTALTVAVSDVPGLVPIEHGVGINWTHCPDCGEPMLTVVFVGDPDKSTEEWIELLSEAARITKEGSSMAFNHEIAALLGSPGHEKRED